MVRFENLNFYELLEVPVNATSFEIRQAYRNALSIYEEDSMISDSFFTDEERNIILRRIEEAFSTLIDKGHRATYNKELAGSGVIDAAALEKAKRMLPGFADPLLNLGILYQAAGHRGVAARYFEQALAADPDCAEAKCRLTRMGKSTSLPA